MGIRMIAEYKLSDDVLLVQSTSETHIGLWASGELSVLNLDDGVLAKWHGAGCDACMLLVQDGSRLIAGGPDGIRLRTRDGVDEKRSNLGLVRAISALKGDLVAIFLGPPSRVVLFDVRRWRVLIEVVGEWPVWRRINDEYFLVVADAMQGPGRVCIVKLDSEGRIEWFKPSIWFNSELIEPELSSNLRWLSCVMLDSDTLVVWDTSDLSKCIYRSENVYGATGFIGDTSRIIISRDTCLEVVDVHDGVTIASWDHGGAPPRYLVCNGSGGRLYAIDYSGNMRVFDVAECIGLAGIVDSSKCRLPNRFAKVRVTDLIQENDRVWLR